MREIKKVWADLAPRWAAGGELSEKDRDQLQEVIETETQATLRQLIQIVHCGELLKDGDLAEFKRVLDKWK